MSNLHYNYGKLITEEIQITSGGTNGYVLTSDSLGNASWQISSVTADTNTFTTGTTLNGVILEFNRNDLSNAYSVDLSSLQFTGNTSGNCITDLYVSNLYGCSPITVHDTINSVNGIISTSGLTGGQLNLKYGGNEGEVLLSNDNGAFTKEQLYLSSGYIEINSYSTEGYIRINTNNSDNYTSDAFIGHYNLLGGARSGIISAIGKFDVLADYFAAGIVKSGNTSAWNIVTFENNIFNAGTVNNDTYPTFISSRNSTVEEGVVNSVILGGEDIVATQNNTVYVPYLNISGLGTGTSVNNLGIDSNGNVVTGESTDDTNFANTNLTFTGNREHNTSGNSLTITSDNGGFTEFYIQGDPVSPTPFLLFGYGSQYIYQTDTSTEIYSNNVNRIKMITGETIINENGNNIDFRVEGDTDTHLLFVDAGTDEVGVGTNNPLGKLHITNTENNSVLVIDGLKGGNLLSKWQHYTAQGDVTTTSTNTSNIATISLNNEERITLTGKITARGAGNLTVGGTFTAVANCESGTANIIGTVDTSIMENSAGIPSVNVVTSGSNVIIQVTGGGENLTWLCTYEYQIIAPSAS